MPLDKTLLIHLGGFMKILSTIVLFSLLSISQVNAEIEFPNNFNVPNDIKSFAVDIIKSKCPYALQSSVTLISLNVQKIEVDQGITDYRYSLYFSVVDGNDYEDFRLVIFKADISNPAIDPLSLESLYSNTGLCH